MKKLNNEDIRAQFPVANKINYFDNAALVLKPQVAIDAVNKFYTENSISSRTADTPLGVEVNQVLKRTRQKTGKLIDATENEVIFTSGTTESINLFVAMSRQILKPGDEILLSSYNHSSNLLPWIEIAKETQSTIKLSETIVDQITSKTKIISYSSETNNFSQSYDMDEIYTRAKDVGAIVVNDAAQAIAHQKVSLKNNDVIVFSTNKLYGPTGLGVLAIKEELLRTIRPVKFGGGSVAKIDTDMTWTLKETIQVYEPGTPNLAGIFMFDKSLDFLNEVGYKRTKEILEKLSNYLYDKLSLLENVDIVTNKGDYITLINIKNINAQDVATYLGSRNIYTISGIFCAPYLRNIKPDHSYLRISLGIYNTYEEIDKLVNELKNGGDFYDF
ncbi:aminotransferase class V-fold PLP-dependent enzyme [Mycoplasma sp. Ms02]|uniref:aminotransferase class V-fold PLP-dependent enzyme n=1 Tax=Mycoplasma sp. Ms02 TaxID=353851 RepID=UPI001C8A2ED5|nr:aminotransferase class V-fold PLP-dependent enzyme [Mycoplasma sp. Ms02]QZE12407.1 aminotransferase class V-fold PLP-dependent enzyme [Mycoplasma sp. Ms02]